MKKIFLLCITAIIGVSLPVFAKFNPPEDYVSRITRSAMMEFNRLDTDGDGRLSPEEYRGKLSRKLTRPEEKAVRNAKKKGTYKTPDQQFATMDEEARGFITLDQFINFYTDMENSNRGKGKYY